MTDHHHTDDHTRPGADERIDALARSAGQQLRRPAPADGITRVQRAKRRRQTAQLGGAGVAAVAILAVGAFAIGGRDASPTVVPATVSTVETDSTTSGTTIAPDDTLPASNPPPTVSPTPPPTSSTPPVDEGLVPEAVYTSNAFVAGGDQGNQQVLDPTTGEVVDTRPLDPEASQAAQQALQGRTLLVGTPVDSVQPELITRRYAVGGITYTTIAIGTEITDPAPATEQLFDRCGQAPVTVTGAGPSALPAAVTRMAISADGRSLAVLATSCPDAGTLADGVATSPFSLSLTIFDAADPASPGRTVLEGLSPLSVETPLTFSPDGRYLSLEVRDDAAASDGQVGDSGFRIIDVASGQEVDNGAAGCGAYGTKWSRFVGPWIGGSSIAVQLSCDDGSFLLVRDVATGEQIRVAPITQGESGSVTSDVDLATYRTPSTAWWAVCDGFSSTCAIGRGNDTLVPLPDTSEASFLPLGFTIGG